MIDTVITVLVFIQLVIAPILILLILLQSGKSDDLGTALGGGGGGSTVLGTGGTSKILVQGTVIFSILFVVNCIALAKLYKTRSERSIGIKQEESITPAPAAAEKPATAPETTTPAEAAPTGPAESKPKTP